MVREAAALGIAVLALMYGGAHAVAAGRQQQTDPQSVARGRTIFLGKGTCHVCHGQEAKGTPMGPDLTDSAWLNADGTLESIQQVVKSGVARPKRYPAPMPPMGGARLRADELEDVARYIFSLGTRAEKTPRYTIPSGAP
jgi:mono/diheme cytochrome c family protein